MLATLPPRRVGMGASTLSAADALRLSPAQVLALINTGWSAPGVSLSNQLALQSLLDGQFKSEVAAGNAQAKKVVQVAASVMTATVVFAPFGVALAGLAVVGQEVLGDVVKLITQGVGPSESCHPVNWPANFYYAKEPPTVASSTPIATLPPIAPIVPGTLRALLIPPLCQAFADVEDCRLLDPSALGSLAFMSNIWIASMVHAWNSGAIGFATDYFVPLIPVGPAVDNRWSGWAGGGVSHTGYQPWQWPPPFIVPGQGQYAFEPLSQVPKSVADPATEWVPNMPLSGGLPTYRWSRIRANTPPFLNVAQKAGAGVGIAAAGVGIYAAVTGQSFVGALKTLYSGAARWF